MNLEIFVKPRVELDLFKAFSFYDEQSFCFCEEFVFSEFRRSSFVRSMNDKETTICRSFKEIETEFDVTIFYACESGSRAWGFESTDSDYVPIMT